MFFSLFPKNPHEADILKNFNDPNQSELCSEIGDGYLVCFKGNRALAAILVSHEKSCDECEETETQLVSDLRDIILPKVGASSTRKTAPTRKGNREKSTLIFGQETTSRKGQPSSHRGRSSATHEENVIEFEKAGIPIDPFRNPNSKPDMIQKWRWSKNHKKWVVDGERRVQVGSKIMTEKQWQSILINKSRQA